FFVLSAFLITELLLQEKQQFGKIHLKAFYVRRILRIWPLYFTAIAIGLLVSHFVVEQELPLRYVAGFLLLCGNWVISATGFPHSVMGPLWSVSFEEQFYLLWPGFLAHAKRRALIYGSIAMLVTSTIARVFFWSQSFE